VEVDVVEDVSVKLEEEDAIEVEEGKFVVPVGTSLLYVDIGEEVCEGEARIEEIRSSSMPSILMPIPHP